MQPSGVQTDAILLFFFVPRLVSPMNISAVYTAMTVALIFLFTVSCWFVLFRWRGWVGGGDCHRRTGVTCVQRQNRDVDPKRYGVPQVQHRGRFLRTGGYGYWPSGGGGDGRGDTEGRPGKPRRKRNH